MTLVMGIVNVTPDSFSDGGYYLPRTAAIAHGLDLAEQGADILDIGGESTRPGAKPVPVEDEIARVLPVIEGLKPFAATRGIHLSIDTRNAATMRAALAVGIDIVNDVSGFTYDAQTLDCLAAAPCDVVAVHTPGTPETMQSLAQYDDVVATVEAWMQRTVAVAEAAGVARSRLILDPGIGFGKTAQHNIALLRAVPRLRRLGCRILIGASRKQFIARISNDEAPVDRLGGSLAAALHAAAAGADIVRVHDVAATNQALRVQAALRAAAE
jgi:dihydropteroate synthase